MPGDNGNIRFGEHPNIMWSDSEQNAELPRRPHLHRELNSAHGEHATIHNEAHTRLATALDAGEIDNDAFREASQALDQLIRGGRHLQNFNSFKDDIDAVLENAFNGAGYTP